MININKLHDLFKYEENFLYKDNILKKFATNYLNSNQNSNYKLYHQYIFRSDIVENHIKEHYSYKLKNTKFNWKNKLIKEQILDWSHFFIGYTKFSNYNHFCELFLSIKYFDSKNKEFHCTGYSINTHDPKYDYSFENTIELNYTNFNYPIIIDSEIGNSLKKFSSY